MTAVLFPLCDTYLKKFLIYAFEYFRVCAIYV